VVAGIVSAKKNKIPLRIPSKQLLPEILGKRPRMP
jgi:hypothetical protein